MEIPPSLGLGFGLERLAAGPAIVPACRLLVLADCRVQRVFWFLPSVSSRLLCSMAYIGLFFFFFFFFLSPWRFL
jgi:hypothetical protein